MASIKMDEYTIRASSFPMIFDCAHRWEGIHLLGMNTWVGMPAVMGSAIHASTAAFDQGRIDGSWISADDAAETLIERLQHPGEDYRQQEGDLSYKRAEAVCLTLHARYCTGWSPSFNFESVEMKTEPLVIDCGDNISIRITGTLDRARIIRTFGERGIIDLKTGRAAVIKGKADTSKHKAQIGTYELLYEHTTGKRINGASGVIGLRTSGSPEIGYGDIHNAKLAMLGTPDQPGWIQIASNMFKTGMFPGNPSSTLCSPKYCPRWKTCIFR